MKFRLVVEFHALSGRCSAGFPELPGRATAGDTREKAISNAAEALEFWFEPAA